MAKVGIPILVLFSMFLVALPNNLSQMPEQISPLRPLCASQFALVNYACSMVPLVPLPPGTPSPLELEHTNEHRHGHRHSLSHSHSHSHRPRHGHHETPQQNYCCRWLKLVDAECVCDILVHLPAFLSRPNHQYTVVLDETCSFTYSCDGRLRP
ncbi:hypothetical protein CRYUN_Cryun23aG0090600 [Craigia yunnanensis]